MLYYISIYFHEILDIYNKYISSYKSQYIHICKKDANLNLLNYMLLSRIYSVQIGVYRLCAGQYFDICIFY